MARYSGIYNMVGVKRKRYGGTTSRENRDEKLRRLRHDAAQSLQELNAIAQAPDAQLGNACSLLSEFATQVSMDDNYLREVMKKLTREQCTNLITKLLGANEGETRLRYIASFIFPKEAADIARCEAKCDKARYAMTRVAEYALASGYMTKTERFDWHRLQSDIASVAKNCAHRDVDM